MCEHSFSFTILYTVYITKTQFEAVLQKCNEKFNKENCELAGNAYRCITAGLNEEADE